MEKSEGFVVPGNKKEVYKFFKSLCGLKTSDQIMISDVWPNDVDKWIHD